MSMYKYLTQYNSPNYWEGNTPQYIVIHHWGADGQNFYGVVNWLCRKNGNTSAHYILQDGLVACIINEGNAAWHAGNRWYNQHSIGIECRPECTTGDVDTLVQLIATIYKHVGKVLPVIGHKDIVSTACPGRYYSKLGDIQGRATTLYKTGKLPEASSGSSSAGSDDLVVDGEIGYKSVKKMQKWLGSKYSDGVLSGQLSRLRVYISNFRFGCTFGSGGSYTVRLLQKKVGSTVDGYLGKNTIVALQKFLNKQGYSLLVDGKAGYNTCKAFQRYLNKVL